MQKNEREDKYKELFSTAEGKEVLVDILGFAGFGSSKPNDIQGLTRAAGREDVALHILKQLKQVDQLSPGNLLDKNIIDTIF